jgi:hypothetical protein
MGILDDAIREHLELIRQHGAADSEVQRLEDEAFGPPTRPGEADFPESEEAQAPSGNGVATEAAVDEPEPEDAAAHEDVTTLLSTDQGGAEPDSAEEPVEEPEATAVEAEPAIEPDEPVAEEHPVVDEAGSEPQQEPADEVAVPAEERTTLYDRSQDDELDIDLDLRLDEEPQAEELPSEEPPAGELPSEEPQADELPSEEHGIVEPEGTKPIEPPVESLDTVEHPFPEEIVESEEPREEESPSEEHALQEEPAASEDEEEGEDAGEDVLADTPEFLKDRPEDDELWFEQGEPKDFEF